jgi:glycyl-tRNA synthetase
MVMHHSRTGDLAALAPAPPRVATMQKIVALAKRRGFVYPGSAIYGGLANTWEYGPLGVELKNNVKRLWWRTFVHRRRDVVGIDGGILLHPRVWEASGHVAGFTDPLVDCRTCKERFRADHLIEERLGRRTEGLALATMTALLAEAELPCPRCGNRTLTDARQFNLMFETTIGPVSTSGTRAYLRPETAQNMFVDYQQVLDTTRIRLPFGIAQQGRAFRNEITPGNFIFRQLEFEQMEIEYFVRPEEGAAAFERWLATMQGWLRTLGVRAERLRMREHAPEERSHYSARTVDIEYDFPAPMGWKELYGLANRTDYDLSRHMEVSGKDLRYFDQATGTRFIPHVIEPTFGVDRTVLVLLLDAYAEEATVGAGGKEDTRVVLRLSPLVAPYKAAILPLLRRPELVAAARGLFERLGDELDAPLDFDDSGSIGKGYRRQDEIGTPFCVTVDVDTLSDGAVTVRDRDTMGQERLPIDDLAAHLAARLRSAAR